MKFEAFLEQASKPAFFVQQPVIFFKCKPGDNPVLFFLLLFEQLKRSSDVALVEFIDIMQEEQSAVLAKLNTSFLGMRVIYWLKNSHELEVAARDFWASYLSRYQGEHTLALLLPEDFVVSGKNKAFVIEVESLVDRRLFVGLMGLFGKQLSATSKGLIEKIFAEYRAVPLDTACMLMHYVTLLGAKSDLFREHWLKHIISTEKSLFTLSQYFFAKDQRAFFKHWAAVFDDYPEVFWISFWSEQIWQAYQVTKLLANKKIMDAKRVGYRLPFTFMQRDWKKHSPDELCRAHQFVYSLDVAFKNGSSPLFLDLFYSKFFLGLFAQLR